MTAEKQADISPVFLFPCLPAPCFFTEAEIKEQHIGKRYGRITWQDDYTTSCTITWYESKKELRITGFGRGKSPLNPEYTGALFILTKDSPEDYRGFIFNTDDDIQDFLASLHPQLRVWSPDVYSFDKIPEVVKRADAIWVACCAIIASISGSMFPAYIAGKVWPVDALRYE